jgi:hypothetical protein
VKLLMFCALLITLGGARAQAPDTPIAFLAGRPILSSQVKGSTDQARANRLGEMVVGPAVQAYLAQHRQAWEVTESDIRAYIEAERQHARCRPAEQEAIPPEHKREFARMSLSSLKVQRFIYERHGGGRLRFQQMGVEAFDAMQRLILDLERRGAFAIPDPALRERVLGYYLEPRGPLMDDPGFDKALRIEQLFDSPCPAR